MKVRELRSLTAEDIEKQLNDAHQELFNLRFQSATGQLKNYGRIKEVKKTIARLETIRRERELAEYYSAQSR